MPLSLTIAALVSGIRTKSRTSRRDRTQSILNEGLATALEPGGPEWASAHLERDATRVPHARLTTGFGRLPADEARAAYAQSARAVRKMMDLRGAPAVVALLQALGRGVPFESAFQQAISMRYEDFVAGLRE